MRRTLSAISLLLVLALGTVACRQGASTSTLLPGNLQVHVQDTAGNPLPGAKVVSNTQPAGQLKVTGMTDASGTVTFMGIATGDYEFYVSCAGFLQKTLSLTVNSSGTSITVTMTREPSPTTVPTSTPVSVSFQDLTGQPDKYNDKVVTVQGFWFDGFEIVILAERLDPATFAVGSLQPAGAKIWIKGGLPADVASRLFLQSNNPTGYPAHFGKLELTGTFEFGGRYGHLDAYQYQLTLLGARTLPWNPSQT